MQRITGVRVTRSVALTSVFLLSALLGACFPSSPTQVSPTEPAPTFAPTSAPPTSMPSPPPTMAPPTAAESPVAPGLTAAPAAGATAEPTPSRVAQPAVAARGYRLAVTNSTSDTVSLVDPATGEITSIEAADSPWGIVVDRRGRAYVSAAQGVAILDLRGKERLAFVPFPRPVEEVGFGEYRAGGMGLALSPDEKRVFVGVYRREGSAVEVLDTASRAFVASVPVGVRPFDVVAARDRSAAYAIDHDSYSITALDARTLTPTTIEAAPIGRGAFDKPHYAAQARDGKLYLPYQGRVLWEVDPVTGASRSLPLTSDTHQHGAAFAPDGRLLIIGTGPAGDASKGPSLTIYDLATGEETLAPLARPHEQVVASPDGRLAYLTGGYLLGGGWDGITVVNLETLEQREIPVPDAPLGIAILPPSPSEATACMMAQPGAANEPDLALIRAAEAGDAEEVAALLTRGASVVAADNRGWTALVAAAYGNHLDAARLLIDAGANINAKDQTQQSAYLIATSEIPRVEGYERLLLMTLAAGADVDCKDSYNGTGLIRAADRGYTEIVRELLATPIDIDHVNRLGWTALLEAIILGDGDAQHVEVVRQLVAAGASVNLADGQGVTPLAHARRLGYTEIVAILESAGAR